MENNNQNECNVPSSNDADDFKKTLNILGNFMSSKESGIVLSRKRELVDRTINGILQDIKELNESREPIAPQEKYKDINEVIKIFKYIVLQQTITSTTSCFIENYCLLAKNWNNNVIKSNDLNLEINVLLNLINDHWTFVELRQEIKKLINRVKEMSNFSAPSFDLSRHYLQSFKDLEQNDPEKYKEVTKVGVKQKSPAIGERRKENEKSNQENKVLPPAIEKRNNEEKLKKENSELLNLGFDKI